jgi:hypothetical protein
MALQGFRRFLAALACIVVGGASFALSFVALRDVAIDLQAVPANLGWLVPIVIDGGVICGSAIIWTLSREQTRRPAFPFLFVAFLVVVSVVVNASHAGPALLAKLIAALPPLILLGTLELVASQGRRLSAGETSTTLSAAPAAVTSPNGSVPTSFHAAPVTMPTEASEPRQEPQRPVSIPSASAAARELTTAHEPAVSIDDSDAVHELEAAVEEAFEPVGWTTPEQVDSKTESGYTRPTAQTRRKATRIRAEQPLN